MPTNRGTEGESPEIRNYCRKCQGIALEVRAAAEGEDSRTIGGYAVKYNTPVLIVDRWGDKYLEEIAAGCFDESLNSCKEAGKEIKALWNHDTSRPLGSTKTDTLRFNTADTTGLQIRRYTVLELEGRIRHWKRTGIHRRNLRTCSPSRGRRLEQRCFRWLPRCLLWQLPLECQRYRWRALRL